MKFKRVSAAVLAAALSATSVSICAFAEEDAAMKTAMTYVKQRIDIPETYSDFSYRTYTDNNNTQYRFTWKETNEQGQTSSISISITGKVIKSVNINKSVNYNYDDDDVWIEDGGTGFAKLSDSKIKAACLKYIKQINPTIYKDIKIDEDSLSISLWGNNATMSFSRCYKDIPVTNQSGSVTVNKDTGDLISYRINWINGAGFSDAKDAISVADAQKAYKKLFPLEKVYTLEYDWENDSYTPHLIYRQTTSGQINAFTGELSKFEDYGNYDNGSDDMVATEAAAMADEIGDDDADSAMGGKVVTFTAEELEKLEKEAKLIKAEDALKMLQDMGIFYIPTESEVTWQSCSYNEKLGYYIRNVSFSGKDKRYIDLNGDGKVRPLSDDDYEDYNIWGNFSINAETGEVRSFYSSSFDNGSNMDSSYDKKANDILGKLLGDKFKDDFGEVANTYSSKVYKEYDSKTGKPIGEPRITSKTYNANRKAYGITCIDESVNLVIGNNGYVTSFSSSYRPDISYPKPDNIISANKAYKSFFNAVGLDLKYRCAYRTDTKKVVTALVYSANDTLRIDAFTGKRVFWNGRPYSEAEETSNYTDLENSKYKKYAEKLRKYGITLMDKDNKLNENEAITASDFLNLLNWLSGYNSYKPALAFKEDVQLDRQKAAFIIVSAKYGDDVAKLKDLFKAKFSDVKEDSKYFGYIAIANASGDLKGSGDKFDPTKKFTRGDALMYVYNALSR